MNPFQHLHLLGHHAYFVHSFKDSVTHLKEYLKKKFNINHAQNPDFFHEKFDVLAIDDSRRIKDLHSSKSFLAGSKKIFILEADGITHEAQNALLKVFEEPHEDTHFFMVMPSVSILLPTLRSRLLVLETPHEEITVFTEIEKFLKLSPKDKVDFVDEIAQDITDEKATKADAQRFLATLEMALYQKGVEKNSEGLKAVLKARDYLNDRGASVKQLLEYVALSL